MSANIEASLRLEIAQYQAAMAKARGDISKLKEHAKREGAGLGQNLFKGVAAFAAGGTIIAAGNAALQTVVKMDRMTRAMTTMEGSAAGAEARLAELRETAKLPGIGFEQAVQGDIRLRSVGLSAETSKQALIEFGNALALSGGSASDLDGVILALGQISSKGKVSAEEINQIAERVPQIRAVMKDVFGTADTEALQKMGISADDFITRTIAGFGQLERATAGLDESLSDIGQSIKTIINEGAGPIVNELVPAFGELATAVAQNKDLFAELGTSAVTAMQMIGNAFKFTGQTIGGIAFAMAGSTKDFQKEMDIIDPRLLEKARAAGLGSTANQVEDNRVGNRGAFAEKALGQQEAERQASSKSSVALPKKGTAAAAATPKTEGGASDKDRLTAQKEINQLLSAEEALSEKRMADYLSILPANLQLLEIKREILRLEQQRDGLTGPGFDEQRLDIETKLLNLRQQSRSAEKEMADEKQRAADTAKFEAEKAASQSGALSSFEAEMALIDAKLAKDKDLTAELEKQAEIQRLQNQLMSEAGLSQDQALAKASERYDKEQQLKNQLNQAKENSRYDAEGRRADGRKQIKGYSAENQGDATDARARAEERNQASAAKRQAAYDRGFGLDEQTRKNAQSVAGGAMQNKAQDNAAPKSDGSNIITLVQQIAQNVALMPPLLQ